MGCYLQYGSYQHALNEASFTVAKNAIMNDADQPYAEEITWTISGKVGDEGDSPVTVANKFAALEFAYSRWGRDLLFKEDNGNLLQALRNNGSLTGTRVIQPPFCPVAEGAQFVGFRDYTIVVSAQYPMSGAFGSKFLLRSFKETLAFSGGGPRQTVVELVNALPQPQVLALYTASRAVQSGQAVGLFGYPLVPPPIFGTGLLEESPSIVYGGPQLRNGLFTDFEVSWQYQFISALPLAGLPNAWPAG